jgi:HEAT repeat protein
VHIRAQAAAFLAQQVDVRGGPISEKDVDTITIKGLHYLSKIPPESQQTQIALSLALDQAYYRPLIDPALLTAEQSITAAKRLSEVDTRFLPGIVNAANEKSDRAHVTRVLHILRSLERTNLVAQWVRRMTEHSDCFIRSMAVSMLCRLHVNPQLIEKQLDSADARVRANAIEALWGTLSWNSRRLLERATSDPHHRVAVNAVLGLYLAGIPQATERMTALAQDQSPMFRAAVAWTMGYTCDETFLPSLEQLSRDPEENVRKAAIAALAKYPQKLPTQ